MSTVFQLNGKPADAVTGSTIAELLAGRDIDPLHVVVEVNQAIINRDDFAATVIDPGDRVEILRFVGGG